ncbi:MAG: SPASM domain-containing protein, partial [Candidatus Cloacimonetes bacterium]|nr:SPASM domain-containing protein [Candidatus Cloacimonadota bacterium]
HNEHELPEVKRLATELQVDKLELKTVQIYSKDDLKYLPSDHKYSRYHNTGDNFELKTKLKNRCRRLWTQPVINWDGEMNICCYDKDGSFPIGNIDDTSFRDLWFGKYMNKMRAAILKNRAAIEICRNCGEGIVQNVKSGDKHR